MNFEEAEKTMHEIGIFPQSPRPTHWGGFVSVFERFANVVEAKEREACAKACDARYMGDNNREDQEAKGCAAAIRAKGQA